MLSLLLAIIGFFSLAMAMQRHHSQLFNKRKVSNTESRWLKILGFSLLTAAAVAAVQQYGLGNGLVFWTVYLCMAVYSLAMLFAFIESKKKNKRGR